MVIQITRPYVPPTSLKSRSTRHNEPPFSDLLSSSHTSRKGPEHCILLHSIYQPQEDHHQTTRDAPSRARSHPCPGVNL